jgi:hypothetical protein
MRHRTNRRFWEHYTQLPTEVQKQADKAFEQLKADPRHPSLHFKKVGVFWSARVSQDYRAVAVQKGDDLVWFWIGAHDGYEEVIAR